MCGFIFTTACTYVCKISHSKKNSARCYHKCTYIGLEVKHLIFLADFNRTWIFFIYFRNITKYQISWKSSSGTRVVPCGRTGRQTDRHDEVSVAFRSFSNAPENSNGSYLKLRREFRRHFLSRSVHDSLARTLCAQRHLKERESSVPGYDAVSLGKYLPTLLRNFAKYLSSLTASHLQQQRCENPTSIFTKNNLLLQPCQL